MSLMQIAQSKKKLSFFENNDDHYVGRITTDGQRDFYIYTNNIKEHWQNFICQNLSNSSRKITHDYTDDLQHATYWDKLYPNTAAFRAITNLHLVRLTQQENSDN